MSLLAELKRRNIFLVAILYVVCGWLLLQAVDLMLGGGDLSWIFRFLFALLVICFPLILVFAWIFELTPEGLRKERNVARERSITLQTGRRIQRAIKWTFLTALLLQIISWIAL